MRVRCALVLLLGALTGCGGLVRPSELRPPPHPLLEGFGFGEGAPAPAATSERDTQPALAKARRRLIQRNLKRVLGERRLEGEPAADLALVRAAYEGLGLDSAPERASTTGGLRRRARARTSAPRTGDLAFFHEAPGVPRVGVVYARRADGVVEVVCVTRGAVRLTRVDPARPHLRRDGKEVVNTFLRARRPGDKPGSAYLAGALLGDFRTLLD